ncbi:hypothetical protein JCM3775_006089 [Rhodotorula graminis]
MLLGKDLYRQLLKEARHLPDSRVSEHYLHAIRTSFKQPPPPESSSQAVRRVKHAQKLLRHLQAANDGYLHALTRAFETAYGLRGPQKHVALSPFLEPGLPNRSFPPALAALVTSPVAHLSRPPTPAHLLTPPTLPERADPRSEAARLLGPLPDERIRAVKCRWWNLQTGKVRAPLAVKVRRGGIDVDDCAEALAVLERAGLGGMREGLLRDGWRKLAELERKAVGEQADGEVAPVRPLPPRRLQTPEQRAASHPPPLPPSRRIAEHEADAEPRILSPSARATKWHRPKHLTARLLRRRAAAVLEQAPIVVVHVPAEGEGAAEGVGREAEGKVRFEVVRSDKAKGEKGQYRDMTSEETWWQEWAASLTPAKPGKGAKKQR